MSKEGSTFVPIQSYLEKGNAWDKEEVDEAPASKSGNAWGKPAEPAKVVSLKDQMKAEEEEAKRRKEQEAQQQSSRQPASTNTYKPSRRNEGGDDSWGARSSYGNRDDSYGNSGGRDYGNREGSSYGNRDYGNREGSYGGNRDGGNREGSYGGNREGSYGGNRETTQREYKPREKNPIPSNPPFTAYIGNLPFNKASEEELATFFEGLNVVDIRIIRDQDSRPKGYAYIEFKERENLEDALKADGFELGGRHINVDVASHRDRDSSSGSTWGSSREGGYASNFRGGDRDRDSNSKYEPSSGGGSWRNQNAVSSHAPSSSSSGPPRLGLQPRSKPLEDIGSSVAKRAGEDPFGGATTDAAKAKRIAEERLRREDESDRKRQEALERAQKEREAHREAKNKNETDSWRGRSERDTKKSGPVRYDNAWGPSADKASGEAKYKRPEPKKALSKQEAEKASAIVNSFSALNTGDDDKE